MADRTRALPGKVERHLPRPSGCLRSGLRWALVAATLLVGLLLPNQTKPSPGLSPGMLSWRYGDHVTIRGITIGPIESTLHRDRGYGTEFSARAMREARRMGASWISLTPFGRVWDLAPSGVSLTFEAPFRQNRQAVKSAIRQAHAEGLRVLLIPQLWVDTGDWRGDIDPIDDDAWGRWAESYHAFIREWAAVARQAEADMFSVGVELRSWVTTTRAPSFVSIIRDIRREYPGLIT